MSQFSNVSVVKKANVYFDGKCVSHTVHFPDGSRKSIGVIFPGKLTFNTGEREKMEVVSGHCRARLPCQMEWRIYHAGDSFDVPANSTFEIEALEQLDYVCHFG